MSDIGGLLLALQHADSFFPSGGISFSWGLERLSADGVILSKQQLWSFVDSQLRHRWATSDRAVLVAVHGAGADQHTVVEIDRHLEVLTLPALLREGSKRAGATLLSVHARLGTARAVAYQNRIRKGQAPGHLAVVQGLVWGGLQIDEETASAMSAYSLAVSLMGAALRMGLIGHQDAQLCLTQACETIGMILSEAPPAIEEMSAYTPLADVATMRHELAEPRLFAN